MAKKVIRLSRAALPSVKSAKIHDAEAKRHAVAARRHYKLWLHHLAMEAAAKVKRDKAIERALRHRGR